MIYFIKNHWAMLLVGWLTVVTFCLMFFAGSARFNELYDSDKNEEEKDND